MIATILSLNGGLLTTILCIHNQYLVTINSQIKLSVCLSVCLSNVTHYYVKHYKKTCFHLYDYRLNHVKCFITMMIIIINISFIIYTCTMFWKTQHGDLFKMRTKVCLLKCW